MIRGMDFLKRYMTAVVPYLGYMIIAKGSEFVFVFDTDACQGSGFDVESATVVAMQVVPR